MAKIYPFSAVRPRADLVDKIAALPYDVYSRKEAYEKVKGDKLSFLRIDRPETQFDEDYDMYAPEVYQKAKSMLEDMLRNGEYIVEDKPVYYVYELVMDKRSQVGIGACASVQDYEQNVIKKHENTRADKEADRIRHVDTCNAQTGPIFLAYRNNAAIEQEVQKAMTGEPVYQFTSEDNITHRIWIIDEEEAIRNITEAFDKIDAIYIADGHHRCASAVRVSQMRRENNPKHRGDEEYNRFLSVLFPDNQLMIMDYNRVVKNLNGLTKDEFLDKTEKIFEVTLLGKEPCKPSKKGEVTMLLGDNWYRIDMSGKNTKDNPVDSLDVAILQRELLDPILGIKDPKTDKNIDFVGGIRGLTELERRVHEDCAVAFAMYPTGIEELFQVADAGLLMPPKSTWFEPKLRSGLLIHQI